MLKLPKRLYRRFAPVYQRVSPSPPRLVVQCSYPGMGLHQLSSTFQSDADGTGTLVHTKPGGEPLAFNARFVPRLLL